VLESGCFRGGQPYDRPRHYQLDVQGAGPIDKETIQSIYGDAIDWCQGKSWLARLPFLAWFTYLLIKYLQDPRYWNVFSYLNLGIHELGHYVFSFFGVFVHVLGGTLLECLAPVFGVINFYRQRDFFAIAVCFGWLSTVLFGVAAYAGDARTMGLPLVTPFGLDTPVTHDWNYLLSRLGLLQYDAAVAFLIRGAAVISMLVCLITGIWLLWNMRDSDLRACK
jgi:hypothetical protein